MEAITRSEKLMDGQYVEPITREEKILAGEDLETVTRREYFLKKYRGGGGDISVVQLSVTENGVYTAPSGKAYSPVNVEVPTPENAYFLKSVAGLPSEIASFSDGASMPMKELEVSIEPIQDLHGYDNPWAGGSKKNKFGGNYNELFPLHIESGTTVTAYTDVNASINYYKSDGETRIDYWSVTSSGRSFTLSEDAYYWKFSGASTTPTKMYIAIESSFSGYEPYSNICPISGWTACNVTVCDDVDNPTVENEYTIQFTDGDNPLTVYGGTLDVTTGVLTVDKMYIKLDGSEEWDYESVAQGNLFRFTTTLKETAITPTNFYCSAYKPVARANRTNGTVSGDYRYIDFIDDRFNSASAWKENLRSNNVEIVFPLATPQTYSLTPSAVASILGQNNVFADTGEVNEVQYLSKEV